MFRYISTSIFITLSTLTYGQGRHIIYQKDKGTASISGTVLNEFSGEPFVGEVIAYKIEDGPYMPIDTVELDEEGVYFFANLPFNKYILWAAAKEESVRNHYSTYYPHEEFYSNAGIIDLKENIDSVNISMIYIAFPVSEPGDKLDVKVEVDEGLYRESYGLSQIQCALFRKVQFADKSIEYLLNDFRRTDSKGEFYIGNMEPGQYLFHVEYPGIPSDPEAYFEIADYNYRTEIQAEITLSKINIQIEKISLIALQIANFPKMEGFPNPVTHNYILNYELRGSTESLQFALYSTIGKLVLSDELDSGIGKHQKSIDLENFRSGIYILKVFNADRSIARTLRIVKN